MSQDHGLRVNEGRRQLSIGVLGLEKDHRELPPQILRIRGWPDLSEPTTREDRSAWQ